MKSIKIRYVWRASLLMVLALVGVMASGVLAVQDGRINEVAHAGGHVLYCWDDNGLITNNYGDGRIVVLSPNGNLLLEADGAELARLVALANAGELPETQLVTTATDRFGTGEISLWVRTNGFFMLTGTDEHGKAFDFQWQGCQPVSAPTAEEPDAPVETEEPEKPTDPCENVESEECLGDGPPDPCENVESEECLGNEPPCIECEPIIIICEGDFCEGPPSPPQPPPPCIECEPTIIIEEPLCFDDAFNLVKCDYSGDR